MAGALALRGHLALRKESGLTLPSRDLRLLVVGGKKKRKRREPEWSSPLDGRKRRHLRSTKRFFSPLLLSRKREEKVTPPLFVVPVHHLERGGRGEKKKGRERTIRMFLS